MNYLEIIMLENNTKIRELGEDTVNSVDFLNYLSKKTINSLIKKKAIKKLAKSHILVL